MPLTATPIPPLHVQYLRAHLLGVPVAQPVRNSFRVLRERSVLLVEVIDADGVSGWGEIWCNYPPGAALHRSRLLMEVVAPLLTGQIFPDPGAAFHHLEQVLRVPALQCGEPGPFAQVAAGLDVALWDLAARKAAQPLWRWLGGVPVVRVYASGLGPEQPERIAAQKLEEGFRAVKLKVGFDAEIDATNMRNLRAIVGEAGGIMLDANQRWDVEGAVAAARRFAEWNPLWLEEPVPADEPAAAWRNLASRVDIPLAAGENLRGALSFNEMTVSGGVRVIQPDPGKWGGISGCLGIARDAREHGVQFCPHWLGGGIGLLAALNLLGASGGRGVGEVDANPNVLREKFLYQGFKVVDGSVTLSNEPGLGFVPDEDLLNRYRMS